MDNGDQGPLQKSVCILSCVDDRCVLSVNAQLGVVTRKRCLALGYVTPGLHAILDTLPMTLLAVHD